MKKISAATKKTGTLGIFLACFLLILLAKSLSKN